MSDAAARFARRVMVRLTLVAVVSTSAVAAFAPRMLGVEPELGAGIAITAALLEAAALGITLVLAAIALRRQRAVIRALAAGERDLDPRDVAGVANLPAGLSLRAFVVSAALAGVVLLPGIPDKLDDGRSLNLFVLMVTMTGAAAIPLYVITRRVTLELVERAAPEPIAALLEAMELTQAPWRQLTRWVLLAVAAPVALMGAGAVLVVHGHLRTLNEESRRSTAALLARTALEPGEGPLTESARADAVAAAAEFGFVAHHERAPASAPTPTYERESDGQIAVTVPLVDGSARVRFSPDLSPEDTTTGVEVVLVAVLAAAIFGGLFGRALADDLLQATNRVRMLGTESVIRGRTSVARPARFAAVESLGRAIDALTGRFRVFAAAQERALHARSVLVASRSLLFASVSHDLKSPLNAILGFAQLVGQEPLTPAQGESLTLIDRRGRELLALIETILDAARLEAGQLTLSMRSTEVPSIVREAIQKARELVGDVDAKVSVEIEAGLPPLPVDAAHVARALGVIVAHAARSAEVGAPGRPVRVRATAPADAIGRVRIDVELASRALSREEMARLFARTASGRGRGLTLGLSLARSVIELHGGVIEVDSAQDGVTVCRVWLPVVAPGVQPRLSALPALG